MRHLSEAIQPSQIKTDSRAPRALQIKLNVIQVKFDERNIQNILRRVKISLLLFLFTGTVFSYPLRNESLNVENIIRQSRALSDVQYQLDEAYLTAISKIDKSKIKRLKIDQAAWLKQRDLCKDHDCIHTSLMNRLTEIDRLNKN